MFDKASHNKNADKQQQPDKCEHDATINGNVFQFEFLSRHKKRN